MNFYYLCLLEKKREKKERAQIKFQFNYNKKNKNCNGYRCKFKKNVHVLSFLKKKKVEKNF